MKHLQNQPSVCPPSMDMMITDSQTPMSKKISMSVARTKLNDNYFHMRKIHVSLHINNTSISTASAMFHELAHDFSSIKWLI